MVDLRPVEFKEDSLQFLHAMLGKSYYIISGKYLYGEYGGNQEGMVLLYAHHFVADIVSMGGSVIGMQRRYSFNEIEPQIPPFIVDLADPNSLQAIGCELDRLWRDCRRINNVVLFDIISYEVFRGTLFGRAIRLVFISMFAAYITFNACIVVAKLISG